MRNRSRVRLVFTLLMCSTLAAANDIATKTVTVRKIAHCGANGKKLDIVLQDVVIARSGRNLQTLQAALDVKQDISNDFYMKGDIIKCDVNGNPDHCEYVLKDFRIGNVCAIISAKDEAWTILFDNMDQRIECPIKKGLYTLKKTQMSADMLEVVPSTNAIWKVQYRGFNSAVNVFCIDLELHVKMVMPRMGRGRRQ